MKWTRIVHLIAQSMAALLLTCCVFDESRSAHEVGSQPAELPGVAGPSEAPQEVDPLPTLDECGKPGAPGMRVVTVLFEPPVSLDPKEQEERLNSIALGVGGRAGQAVVLASGAFEIPIDVPSENCWALIEALFM